MSESRDGFGDLVDDADGSALDLSEEVVQAIDQVVSGGELGEAAAGTPVPMRNWPYPVSRRAGGTAAARVRSTSAG
jgi:hypothetical protein